MLPDDVYEDHPMRIFGRRKRIPTHSALDAMSHHLTRRIEHLECKIMALKDDLNARVDKIVAAIEALRTQIGTDAVSGTDANLMLDRIEAAVTPVTPSPASHA